VLRGIQSLTEPHAHSFESSNNKTNEGQYSEFWNRNEDGSNSNEEISDSDGNSFIDIYLHAYPIFSSKLLVALISNSHVESSTPRCH
jgi:hypothetical protein